jgi:putative transposase
LDFEVWQVYYFLPKFFIRIRAIIQGDWTFKDKEIKISMDGKGRCFDNIYQERLWRTVKYEEVYLKSYSSVSEARNNLNKFVNFYNHERPHQSLNYKTPADAEIYFAKIIKPS